MGLSPWLPVGRSEPLAFYKAVVDVVWASRLALFLSAFFLAGGALLAAVGQVAWHMSLMASGLLAFYFAVMYIQLPGFINAAPARWATWLLTALFLFGTAASQFYGYAAYAPFSAVYIALYARGLGKKPTFYPNLVTIPGLALLPLSPTPLMAALSFPLASVYTLLYRIDVSRAKARFRLGAAAALALLYALAWAASLWGHLWSFALPSIALTLAAPPKPRDAYGVGSLFFRAAIALAPLGHHFAYMAFAVIMSTLCVPYFLPSILYREAPSYKYELLAASLAAYVLRNVGLTAPAAALVTGIAGYAALRSAKSKPVPLKPPQ